MYEGEHGSRIHISRRAFTEHSLRQQKEQGAPPLTREQLLAQILRHKLGERHKRLERRQQETQQRQEAKQWWAQYEAERDAKKNKK